MSAKPKRPAIPLSGKSLEQFKSFHRTGQKTFANRMILQTMEGMLIMGALNEIMVLERQLLGDDASESETFHFSISEDQYPRIYREYVTCGYGSKEELFLGYMQIVLDLWSDPESHGRRNNYIQAAKAAKFGDSYNVLPEAPRPSDEIEEEESLVSDKALKSPKDTTQLESVILEAEEIASVLDDIEDTAVFDEFDFDIEDPSPEAEVYDISSDEGADLDFLNNLN